MRKQEPKKAEKLASIALHDWARRERAKAEMRFLLWMFSTVGQLCRQITPTIRETAWKLKLKLHRKER